MSFICPRCDHAGIQADGYAYCTVCRSDRQREARKHEGQRKPRRARSVDGVSMKGFSELSQQYLTRKLV